MMQLLGSKGLLGYVDGRITLPPHLGTGASILAPMPIYSTDPSRDEWHFHDQLARGHITLNCTDIASLGVKTTGMAREAWDSIQNEWGKSTDMRRFYAQEILDWTVYSEGTSEQDHVKLLRARRAAVDNLSTMGMTDEAWRGIIIRSIPPSSKWLPVILSLYTMTLSADLISTLLAHGMILKRGTQGRVSSSSSSTVLAAKTSDGCTNPNCKAKRQSTHTTANCYWPGGGKEGQFPPNFGQRVKANVASVLTCREEHFVLSAWTDVTPGGSGVILDELDQGNDMDMPPFTEGITFGESGVIIDDLDYGNNEGDSPAAFISSHFRAFAGGKIPTFIDSGASDTMFVSCNDFIEYTPVTFCTGDSAKAEDGNFDILGEGKVKQRYLVEGKDLYASPPYTDIECEPHICERFR